MISLGGRLAGASPAGTPPPENSATRVDPLGKKST